MVRRTHSSPGLKGNKQSLMDRLEQGINQKIGDKIFPVFIKDVNKELSAAHKSREAEFRFPLNPAYTRDPLSYRPLSKKIKTIEKFLD